MTPEELKARRTQLGLSQSKLAEALGVTQHTVSRWEEGKIRLTAPRSLWLDVEMAKLKRKPGRPSKRRHRPAAAEQRPDGSRQEGRGVMIPVCQDCGMRHEPDDNASCIEGHGDDPPAAPHAVEATDHE